MEVYILKSAACLAILLLFYKVALERENMHVFKRFYLLFTLVLAAIIPLITFKSYVTAPAAADVVFTNASENVTSRISESLQFNYRYLFYALYAAGILFFSIKFFKNLYELFSRIHKNPKVSFGASIRVLLKEKLPPHTFFQYIFLNKNEFENDTIPKEVLKHEEAHSRQRHSLDIVLLEVFQIIVWFNPLVYLLKKSVKLNHEFLADSAVLKSGVNSHHYQHTLLNFSSKDLHSTLVNPINYSSIKKRLTVMKTQTSKPVLWSKIVLIIPILALLC
ncbi:MAG: M56 family metallopeptidase, partial [Gillisia sp.]